MHVVLWLKQSSFINASTEEMYSKSRQLWLEQFANGEKCSFQTGIFWYFLGTGSKNDFTSWWCTVIKKYIKKNTPNNNKSPILYICQNSTLMILLESSDLGWPCWCLYLIPNSESSFSFSSLFFSPSKKQKTKWPSNSPLWLEPCHLSNF